MIETHRDQRYRDAFRAAHLARGEMFTAIFRMLRPRRH
ncbi:hypothetical protein Ga0080574_TMP2744 [Salipiger abyssi]|uniref:Uncharacterized protein n=1 Tax=Salipiger abyssi TaxID=1250539 RepID=A0A1P8UUP2_9RHOB|nr:hypothetical protein Ga0080574_TMP2744 [Salipiger abyssi]